MHVGRIAAAAALAAALGAATPARALTQGEEAGFSLLAAWANVLYVPAKIVVSAVALPFGALAGWMGGGDTRAAYALWVPAAGGTWFLDHEHLIGQQPIEFFGSDYSDRPSTRPDAVISYTYGAAYESTYSGTSRADQGPNESAR